MSCPSSREITAFSCCTGVVAGLPTTAADLWLGDGGQAVWGAQSFCVEHCRGTGGCTWASSDAGSDGEGFSSESIFDFSNYVPANRHGPANAGSPPSVDPVSVFVLL